MLTLWMAGSTITLGYHILFFDDLLEKAKTEENLKYGNDIFTLSTAIASVLVSLIWPISWSVELINYIQRKRIG